MYFYTHPEAEHKFLSTLGTSGERCWGWIEIAFQTPLFILATDNEIEGGTIGRDFMFGCLEDLLGTINASKGVISIRGIGLLSPGYMNGSNLYKFGTIKEIWHHPSKMVEIFVMDDGTRLQNTPGSGCINEQEMELVLSL